MNDFINSLKEREKQQDAGLQEVDSDGWYTSAQIREQTGWGINKTQKLLSAGVIAGEYEIKKFPAKNIAGATYWIVKYRLIGNGEQDGN